MDMGSDRVRHIVKFPASLVEAYEKDSQKKDRQLSPACPLTGEGKG